MKTVFLVRSLVRGGAERQLSILARGMAERGHDVTIAVFYPGGPLEDELAGSDVDVFSLDKRGRWDNLRPFYRFARMLRRERPDVIHGYMDVANVATVAAKPLVPGTPIVWGIRSAGLDLAEYNWLRRVTFRTETILSRFPDLIVANSEAGYRNRVNLGFPPERTTVIPNGIEVERFRPFAGAGRQMKVACGVPDDARVIGHVARMDPKKDHLTLLRAVSALDETVGEWHLVCVGGGSTARLRELQGFASDLGVADRVTWRGYEDEMPAVYNAFDLLVSSSAFGEGFPNAIGEAMACGVPCVVTDVGDSAKIVGETGIVVPPSRPRELADGIRTMLDRIENDDRAGGRARDRIVERFDSERLVENTIDVLERL